MTQYQKKKYRNHISKMGDDELVREYKQFTDRCIGSLSERMRVLDYPPDMIQEQYEWEKEEDWYLNVLEEELSKRHPTKYLQIC